MNMNIWYFILSCVSLAVDNKDFTQLQNIRVFFYYINIMIAKLPFVKKMSQESVYVPKKDILIQHNLRFFKM